MHKTKHLHLGENDTKEEGDLLASLMEHLRYSPDLSIHDGTIYHSSLYIKERVSEIIKYDGSKFGNLQYFILNPHHAVIVKVFEPSESTILERVGHSCRQVLEDYKEEKNLSMYVIR